MRLADFILENIEPILAEWETFARSFSWGAKMDAVALRDHAEEILRAVAHDMVSGQTAAQQAEKSMGRGGDSEQSSQLNGASELHAIARAGSGFDLLAVIAEYRALRASVIRLWRASHPDPDLRDLDDLTRFNEAIDQSLAKMIRSYSQHVDRSRQMFLAILGHDLRNPLNSMMMSAELLERSARHNVDATDSAAQIKTSAAAMGKMISDLLDFTGTALGGVMPIVHGETDLNRVCLEVIGEMRAAYPNCKLMYESAGKLVGQWDGNRLRQLISNLVGNAIQHGADSCEVRLSIYEDGADVCLTVHNQGEPIPPALLTTIFDPLTHAVSPSTRRSRRPGSIGLGLYIARAVALAHGGTIEVESTAQTGTVFTVRLPRLPGGAGKPRV